MHAHKLDVKGGEAGEKKAVRAKRAGGRKQSDPGEVAASAPPRPRGSSRVSPSPGVSW